MSSGFLPSVARFLGMSHGNRRQTNEILLQPYCVLGTRSGVTTIRVDCERDVIRNFQAVGTRSRAIRAHPSTEDRNGKPGPVRGFAGVKR